MNRQLIKLVSDTIGDKVSQEEFNEIKGALENYVYLSDRDLELTCLEEAGVDNWQGYSDAMEMYEQYKNEE